MRSPTAAEAKRLCHPPARTAICRRRASACPSPPGRPRWPAPPPTAAPGRRLRTDATSSAPTNITTTCGRGEASAAPSRTRHPSRSSSSSMTNRPVPAAAHPCRTTHARRPGRIEELRRAGKVVDRWSAYPTSPGPHSEVTCGRVPLPRSKSSPIAATARRSIALMARTGAGDRGRRRRRRVARTGEGSSGVRRRGRHRPAGNLARAPRNGPYDNRPARGISRSSRNTFRPHARSTAGPHGRVPLLTGAAGPPPFVAATPRFESPRFADRPVVDQPGDRRMMQLLQHVASKRPSPLFAWTARRCDGQHHAIAGGQIDPERSSSNDESIGEQLHAVSFRGARIVAPANFARNYASGAPECKNFG